MASDEWINAGKKEKIVHLLLQVVINARKSHVKIDDLRSQLRKILKKTKDI